MMNRLSVLLSLLVLACKPAPQTTGNVIPAPSHPAAVLNGETGATLTWQHADGSVAGCDTSDSTTAWMRFMAAVPMSTHAVTASASTAAINSTAGQARRLE